MKNIIKITLNVAAVLLVNSVLGSCHEADLEFAHNDNLIHQLSMMKSAQQDTPIYFTITEYDGDGNEITGDITPENVAGGYGMACVHVPFNLYDEVDLHKVYLSAQVTYDAIITPGLTGLHDITGEGIVVSVRAGNGKTRKYRIYGQFD
ncbi:MAG: hypothetical protein K2I89_07505 [Muribaculaceae bacterium]|nr:hypothetical protein [Muribaculaceae bacterium]